jgi:hypothetical protein
VCDPPEGEAQARARADEDALGVLGVLAELDAHPLREDGLVWELTERELRALIAEVERRTREAR